MSAVLIGGVWFDVEVASSGAGSSDERVSASEVERASTARSAPLDDGQEDTTDDETPQCATRETSRAGS